MAYLFIDTDTTELAYNQVTQLDGAEYVLEFMWSARELAWYLTIMDQDENHLADDMKLGTDWPFMRRFQTDPRIPQGLLALADTTGKNENITSPDQLGQRFKLVYITPDDPDLAP